MENLKQKISEYFQHTIKLIFVLIADLYLKNFIKFNVSSFHSTVVSDYVIKSTHLKLNKYKLNHSILKNAKFKISDSNIESISVPFNGFFSFDTVEIDGIEIFLDSFDPDNPDGTQLSRSVGESLILEAQKIKDSVVLPAIPLSECNGFEPFKEIKSIVKDLIEQFNVNINKLTIHLVKYNVDIIVSTIAATYESVQCKGINIIRTNGIGSTILNIDSLVFVRNDKAPEILISNLTIMGIDDNLKLFEKSTSTSTSSSKKEWCIKINTLLFYLEKGVILSGYNILIQKGTTPEIKISMKNFDASKDDLIFLKSSDINITVLTNVLTNGTTSKESHDTELFTKDDKIYSGIVKPRCIKSKTVVYNYIRKQIWSTIINIDANTLVADNSKVNIYNLVSSLIKKLKKSNSDVDKTDKTDDFRIQINVNNIDIKEIYTALDVTGICTCIYIDPLYIVGLSKYLLCTTHDIHLTDLMIVNSRNPAQTHEIGVHIELGDISIDKIINYVNQLKSKSNAKEVSTSCDLSNPNPSQNVLFRSQQHFVKKEKVNYLSDLKFSINIKTLMVQKKTISENGSMELPWLTFEFNESEIYSRNVKTNEPIFFVSQKIICNDIIHFNTFRWVWGDSHDCTIDSIMGTLRPNDLSELFPKEVQLMLKNDLSGVRLGTVDNYQLDNVQKLLRKNSIAARNNEIQRLDSVKIMSNWCLTDQLDTELLKKQTPVFGKVYIKTTCLQFVQESGGPSCITLDIESLRIEADMLNSKITSSIPNLRIRDYVDGSVWSNILATRDTDISFVGGTLDISTLNKIFLNLDSRSVKFINNYSKDTKIEPGKSVIKRIYTTRLDIVVSVKDVISLKNTKIKISPMRIEGPALKEKIIMKLLSENDKLAILLQGIKPLRPFVKIIRDGLLILNMRDTSTSTPERIQKFLHTSATEILELGAAIGSIPESERKKISFYANQPLSTKDGFTEAGGEFVEGVQAIMDMISQNSKAGLLDIPLVMIRPFTNSISKVLLGILNEIDPERREIALNKY
jgi:hypothetical protein